MQQEQDWVRAREVFARYSTRDENGESLSLFQTQLALLALTGREIPLSVIKKTLTQINSQWRQNGIREETFLALREEFPSKSEEEMVYEAYKGLDKFGRGYISLNDFVHVAANTVPRFSRSTVERIFSAADMYEVEKVTYPQFKLLMGGAAGLNGQHV